MTTLGDIIYLPDHAGVRKAFRLTGIRFLNEQMCYQIWFVRHGEIEEIESTMFIGMEQLERLGYR